MESKNIKLKFPIAFGSEKIEEIKFSRPPVAKDMRDLPADSEKWTVGNYLEVASKLTAQPPAVLDKLDLEDLAEVMKAVGELRQRGPETGAPPSAS